MGEQNDGGGLMAGVALLPPLSLNALGWFAFAAAFTVGWALFDSPIDGIVNDMKNAGV